MEAITVIVVSNRGYAREDPVVLCESGVETDGVSGHRRSGRPLTDSGRGRSSGAPTPHLIYRGPPRRPGLDFPGVD